MYFNITIYFLKKGGVGWAMNIYFMYYCAEQIRLLFLLLMHQVDVHGGRRACRAPPTIPEQEVTILYVAADVDAKQIGDGDYRSAPLGLD